MALDPSILQSLRGVNGAKVIKGGTASPVENVETPKVPSSPATADAKKNVQNPELLEALKALRGLQKEPDFSAQKIYVTKKDIEENGDTKLLDDFIEQMAQNLPPVVSL